jgi:hypothetical protein
VPAVPRRVFWPHVSPLGASKQSIVEFGAHAAFHPKFVFFLGDSNFLSFWRRLGALITKKQLRVERSGLHTHARPLAGSTTRAFTHTREYERRCWGITRMQPPNLEEITTGVRGNGGTQNYRLVEN